MKMSGAEATITLNSDRNIEKTRFPKTYRLPEIDNALRSSRTRREERILRKLSKVIPVPKIIKSDEYNIEMEFIDGIQVKRLLDADVSLSQRIATNLSKMHDAGIIHADLTTSNMILKDGTLYFIDFGLSYVSTRIEDKAVDIHLFKQALESKHHTVAHEAFKIFLDNYNPKSRVQILARLAVVEQRGRYKEKT